MRENRSRAGPTSVRPIATCHRGCARASLYAPRVQNYCHERRRFAPRQHGSQVGPSTQTPRSARGGRSRPSGQVRKHAPNILLAVHRGGLLVRYGTLPFRGSAAISWPYTGPSRGRDWNPRAQRSVVLVRLVAASSAGGWSVGRGCLVDCLCAGWFLVRPRKYEALLLFVSAAGELSLLRRVNSLVSLRLSLLCAWNPR
jgi:hypothetical protein